MVSALEAAREEKAREALSIWTAFGLFCRVELGVEAETLVRAYLPTMPADLASFPAVEPDPQLTEEYHATLTDALRPRDGREAEYAQRRAQSDSA